MKVVKTSVVVMGKSRAGVKDAADARQIGHPLNAGFPGVVIVESSKPLKKGLSHRTFDQYISPTRITPGFLPRKRFEQLTVRGRVDPTRTIAFFGNVTATHQVVQVNTFGGKPTIALYDITTTVVRFPVIKILPFATKIMRKERDLTPATTPAWAKDLILSQDGIDEIDAVMHARDDVIS